MAGRDAPADGVLTGYGKVNGRHVAVVAYDFTVMAGAMGMTGEIKVTRLRELALTKRIPLIWLLDSAGARDPGGGRLAVRGHRPAVPRRGHDERRCAADRRRDGALRRRYRLHPGAGRLRADGQGPRLDGAGRTAPGAGRYRRGRHPRGAGREPRAHAQVRCRGPGGRRRSRVHRDDQAVPLLLPPELRRGRSDHRHRRPGRARG